MKRLLPLLVLFCVFGAVACSSDSSLSSEDEKLIDALAVTVAEDATFPGTADDAKCIAEKHVSILGAAYILENNLTDSVAFDDWDPVEAELSRNDFKNLFKEMIGCVDKGIQLTLGEDADLEDLSEESIECLAKQMVNDDFLDALYDAGNLDEDPPDEMIFSMFENCPSFLVDSLVEGMGLDRESAECLADKVGADFLMFSVEAASLPGDEMPEGSTEFLAELFSAAADCDINIEDVFQ